MLPHPDTVCQISIANHRQFQAEAARERLAARAIAMRQARPSAFIRARQRIGAAFIATGRQLQGGDTGAGLSNATLLANAGTVR